MGGFYDSVKTRISDVFKYGKTNIENKDLNAHTDEQEHGIGDFDTNGIENKCIEEGSS